MNNYFKSGVELCSVCQKPKGVIAKARKISHITCIRKIIKETPIKDNNRKARKFKDNFIDYLSEK